MTLGPKYYASSGDVAHPDTTDQTPDDHHAQSHAHDGVDGSGTVAHADTTGQGGDDHHAQSHAHDGVDGSGTVAHADVTGQTQDDHHSTIVHPMRREAVGADATISTPNQIVGCTAHSITVTLASSMLADGAWLTLKDESGGAGGVGQEITIDTEGTETIDGGADWMLNENYEGVSIYSDGTDWFTYARRGAL